MELRIFALQIGFLKYFIEISYNGKNYCGWQNQPDVLSVQEVLEKTLSTMLRKETPVAGAGRTDTGVHAKQLFAHFEMDRIESEIDFVFRVNSFLPRDIAVNSVRAVQEDAHARFDAIRRTYEYHLVSHKSPFHLGLAHRVHHAPNVDLMNAAAQSLLQYHNFQCFSRTKTNVKTYHCVITYAQWEEKEDLLIFTIAADRFLRNMVRAIVGTLLDVGYGKITLEDFHRIIESKDRKNAGKSAPAHGLYLTEVAYPEHIFL